MPSRNGNDFLQQPVAKALKAYKSVPTSYLIDFKELFLWAGTKSFPTKCRSFVTCQAKESFANERVVRIFAMPEGLVLPNVAQVGAAKLDVRRVG